MLVIQLIAFWGRNWQLGPRGGNQETVLQFGNLATMTEKPEIDAPEGPAPDELVIIDEIVGKGAEATAGCAVYVDYVGVLYDSGEEFDASYNRGQPLAFRLGVGQVIQGWDEGLIGMRVGGRRKLIIPSRLAYGEHGAPGAIGPNEALIFVCELREVR